MINQTVTRLLPERMRTLLRMPVHRVELYPQFSRVQSTCEHSQSRFHTNYKAKRKFTEFFHFETQFSNFQCSTQSIMENFERKKRAVKLLISSNTKSSLTVCTNKNKIFLNWNDATPSQSEVIAELRVSVWISLA